MCVFCLQVEEEEIDDPDLSLRLNEGLREHTTGEIQTVIASAADANIYRSAAAFEDIITDKNLLRVRYGRALLDWPAELFTVVVILYRQCSIAGVEAPLKRTVTLI